MLEFRLMSTISSLHQTHYKFNKQHLRQRSRSKGTTGIPETQKILKHASKACYQIPNPSKYSK